MTILLTNMTLLSQILKPIVFCACLSILTYVHLSEHNLPILDVFS